MSLLAEHLRAVYRHGVAVMTGSFFIAAYEILVTGFPDNPGKSWHVWNHIPQWAVWYLVLFGVIFAQFRAWRDLWCERKRLLEERDPMKLEVVRLSTMVDMLKGQVDLLQTSRLANQSPGGRQLGSPPPPRR